MTALLFEDKKGFMKYLLGCFILLSEFLLTNFAIAKIAGVVQSGNLDDLIKYCFPLRMLLWFSSFQGFFVLGLCVTRPLESEGSPLKTS
jgi:hypothetical protein